MVDEYRTLLHSREGTVGLERHGFQIAIAAHARHDKVGIARGRFRRRRALATIFGRPFLGLRRRAVVDDDVMSGALEMSGHGIAHDAKSDEGGAHYSMTSTSLVGAPGTNCGFFIIQMIKKAGMPMTDMKRKSLA